MLVLDDFLSFYSNSLLCTLLEGIISQETLEVADFPTINNDNWDSRLILFVDRDFGNLTNYFHPVDDLSENHMSIVQMGTSLKGEEKLT